MSDQIIALIEEAIKNRNPLRFTYKGFPREVEPHHYGISGSTKKLSAYQVGGKSRTGKIPEWKNFEISLIKELILVTESYFNIRSGYNRNDSKYKTVEMSVEDFLGPELRR